jgi:hypothetical protein
MTDGPGRRFPAGSAAPGRPARHEFPAIDEAALVAARHADRLVAEARARGLDRWVAFLEPLPDRLRDDDPVDLRRTAMRGRAAYGAKDSVRDALPADLTEPFLQSLDRLVRVLNREAHRARG